MFDWMMRLVETVDPLINVSDFCLLSDYTSEYAVRELAPRGAVREAKESGRWKDSSDEETLVEESTY